MQQMQRPGKLQVASLSHYQIRPIAFGTTLSMMGCERPDYRIWPYLQISDRFLLGEGQKKTPTLSHGVGWMYFRMGAEAIKSLLHFVYMGFLIMSPRVPGHTT